MNSIFFYKFINLTLLTILGNLQQTPTVASALGNQISLYNATDKVTVLTSQNFSSTVYNSSTAWLIEFYASWCGHCRSYANIYREIAIDAWAWKTVVRIGAINCYAGDNHALCRQHKVRGFPTLQLIRPDSVFDNTSKAITIPATDAINVEKELIKELENLNRRNNTWPRLIPVNRITLEELYTHQPKTIKVLIIIAEKRDDLIGRQIMLDFSKYHKQIAIFRTTTDGKLWRKFHINVTDIPALFVILRNRTAERINIKQNVSENVDNRNLFNSAIRSYIHKTKSIDNFDDHEFEEIIQSKNALKNAEKNQKLIQNNNLTDDIRDKNTIHRKVHMIDLELALSYMFREEIPQIKDIHGETYNALVQWLTVLTKYFPGREPIMDYLEQLLLKIKQQSNGFNGNEFREMIDMKISNVYLPNDYDQYQHCAGSAPQYRNYPCALWLLFHTLTVSQYKKELNTINVIEIPKAIQNYIKYFFTCRKCSENFMKETMDINQLNLTNKYEAIIYLWKKHNHVNQRLRGDITEDPKYPKVQFPSKYLCKTCQSMHNNEHNISKTIHFLVEYYSKENFDTSLISNHSEIIISKLKYNNAIVTSFEFIITIFQRFAFYIFGFIVLIILFRRRYCKTKRKRYTI